MRQTETLICGKIQNQPSGYIDDYYSYYFYISTNFYKSDDLYSSACEKFILSTGFSAEESEKYLKQFLNDHNVKTVVTEKTCLKTTRTVLIFLLGRPVVLKKQKQ